jgi:hypothetical protein
MARELALIIGLKRNERTTDEAELRQLVQRLATSGYRLRENANLQVIAKQRDEYMGCVDALAEHLGRPTTILIRQS